MQPTIFYCYDAYCGWCYGFSPVMKQVAEEYKVVEETTGIKFGSDYLWHINNPEESDWFPHSEKAAIALCIFKDLYPEKQVAFAADLQYALHYEGRDLTDNEAYRHLLEKYSINEEGFYRKLESEEYKEKALYEFSLCKQLQVTGFPAVLLQTGETKFHLLARGFTDYDTLKQRIESVLKEIQSPAS
jgi:putative protein-disulfide isomerase